MHGGDFEELYVYYIEARVLHAYMLNSWSVLLITDWQPKWKGIYHAFNFSAIISNNYALVIILDLCNQRN